MRRLSLFSWCLAFVFFSGTANAGQLVNGNPRCNTVYSTYLTELYCDGLLVQRLAASPGAAASEVFFDSANFEKTPWGITFKSVANVFSARPLSANYKPYSADGVLDKPVILVEGYDPADNTGPDLYYNRGFNQLVFGGRDLFIVNFPKSGASMDDNATLLQNIILEINAAKTGTHPTAVIGYSMGGLVARKALKQMENAGINHQTSLYVSYDSPHLGANAPMDLQNTVESLINEEDSKTAGKTEDSLKKARYVYNSPAARAMLIAGPDFRPATAADFPNNLARVAVTSGSLLGTSGMQANSVTEGEYVAGFRFYLYKNWLGEWSNTYAWYSQKRGGRYYDNVPGSYEQQFRQAYFQLKDGADYFGVRDEAKAQNITFVPTISSLAIPASPTDSVKEMFRIRSPFDRYIAVDESGVGACDAFQLQQSIGKNVQHSPDYFNSSQLAQLQCALNEYHKIGASIPDRSFKVYDLTTTPVSCLHPKAFFANIVINKNGSIPTPAANAANAFCGIGCGWTTTVVGLVGATDVSLNINCK